MTQQVEGTDVLLTYCEIDGSSGVIRDVCLNLDHVDSSPIDCSVRLTMEDECDESGWMRFGREIAECGIYNRLDGYISQKIEAHQKVVWLQAHPIVGDVLFMKLYDPSTGPGTQNFENLFLTSPDHRGTARPMLFVTALSLIYVGEERLPTLIHRAKVLATNSSFREDTLRAAELIPHGPEGEYPGLSGPVFDRRKIYRC